MPKAAAKQSAGARRRPAERTASRQLTATTRRTPGLTASSRTSPRGHKELNQSSRLEAPAATPTQLYEQRGLHENDRITVATIQPHSTTKRWSTKNTLNHLWASMILLRQMSWNRKNPRNYRKLHRQAVMWGTEMTNIRSKHIMICHPYRRLRAHRWTGLWIPLLAHTSSLTLNL